MADMSLSEYVLKVIRQGKSYWLIKSDGLDPWRYSLIQVNLDRIPLPVIFQLCGVEFNQWDPKARSLESILGSEPQRIFRRGDYKVFPGELLVPDILQALLTSIRHSPDGKGRWWLTPDNMELTVCTRFSRDFANSYDFFRHYKIDPNGVFMYESWSADQPMEKSDRRLFYLEQESITLVYEQARDVVLAILGASESFDCPLCHRPLLHNY